MQVKLASIYCKQNFKTKPQSKPNENTMAKKQKLEPEENEEEEEEPTPL